MFQTVLSNKDHMEYGVVTVPFPIPEGQYADITRMLEVLHVGSELSPDCMVESVEGDWPVLNVLTGQEINLDELDYLAKRLDGFSPYEKVQFQAAAEANCSNLCGCRQWWSSFATSAGHFMLWGLW